MDFLTVIGFMVFAYIAPIPAAMLYVFWLMMEHASNERR